MSSKHKSHIIRNSIFIIILILGVLGTGWYMYKKSDPSCDKWILYHKTNQPVETIADAVKVFAGFLPLESYYARHKLPSTLEGFRKKYNLIPFYTSKEIYQKNGTYNRVEMYDMLLAYGIDKKGNIYAYNQCSLLR